MSDYRYSEADLLDELRRLADELDTAPTFREMNEHGVYNARTYVKRFGGWLDALEAAVLDPDDKPTGNSLARNWRSRPRRSVGRRRSKR